MWDTRKVNDECWVSEGNFDFGKGVGILSSPMHREECPSLASFSPFHWKFPAFFGAKVFPGKRPCMSEVSQSLHERLIHLIS